MPPGRREDLRRADLTGVGVGDRHRLPAEIHEQLLARPVGLPHHQIAPAAPGLIAIAKPGILKAVGMRRLVFLPEQEQGYAFAAQLRVNPRPIRRGTLRAGDRRG